jgi:hypothetical protein
MIFNTPSHGSLVLARQNKSAYLIIVIGAIFVSIFLFVWLLMKTLKKKQHSPEWIESQKKRTTKYSDIKKVTDKFKLSKKESEFLWNICRKNKVPNIQYLIHDNDTIDELFKKEYLDMKVHKSPESLTTLLFRLRYHLEKASASNFIITSTTTLSEGTQLICVSSSGFQTSCILLNNSPDGMLLEIPRQLYDSPERPAELSKVLFTFIAKTGMHYAFVSRIIRYQIGFNNKSGILISHTNDLKTQTQRLSKRVLFDREGLFSAVNVIEGEKSEKFTLHEKKYKCTISNISGDGCCILTSLPIKENQFICIEIPLHDKENTAIGKIVATRKTTDGVFALHIKFIQINPAFQNDLFSFVYNYDTPAE